MAAAVSTHLPDSTQLAVDRTRLAHGTDAHGLGPDGHVAYLVGFHDLVPNSLVTVTATLVGGLGVLLLVAVIFRM